MSSARESVNVAQCFNHGLFKKIYSSHYPFPLQHDIRRENIEYTLFHAYTELKDFYYDLCFSTVLEPLTRADPASLQNLLSYLPPPETDEFPIYALGMTLLLDQIPRIVLSGTDSRWRSCLFDPLALRLIRSLIALPWAQRPDNPARWEAMGYKSGHAALARALMYGPIVHSEDYGEQMMQLGLVETLRRDAESIWKVKDSLRQHEISDARDETMFAKLAILGPPPYADANTSNAKGVEKDGRFIAEPLFWLLRMCRVHEPVVRKFGRYPYLNVNLGRQDTPAEEQFWVDTNGWSKAKEETARVITDDIAAGRWTSLQGRG